MRINFVYLAIAFGIAALLGFGFYSANGHADDKPLVNAIVGGAVLFITLAGALAVSSKDSRGVNVNIRTVSWVFFVIMLIEQAIFCIGRLLVAPYVIITGLLMLVYLLIAYSIGRSMRSEPAVPATVSTVSQNTGSPTAPPAPQASSIPPAFPGDVAVPPVTAPPMPPPPPNINN